MRTLDVALGERAYPIHIGAGLLARVDLLLPLLKAPQVAIITNTTVAPLYLERLAAPLRAAGVQITEVVLPDGEQYKNTVTLNRIYDVLLENRCERSVTVIALGGGVIGDLAGFAAATYQRGVPFIQVPTTLLAQVDSSVGGKTGINHPLGKNMIGAFYQPRAVLTDTETLKTLPDRELRAGLAEVIKYGLIRDLPFLAWIEDHIDELLAKKAEALTYAVERACANKAEIVAEDETESGVRALLNLGHTFGHAIETGMGYGVWLHGEAVAAGMVMAAELSRRMGWLAAADVKRVVDLLRQAGLPVTAPPLGADRYLALMALDKKVSAGKLRLILLESIGRGVISADASSEDLRATIESCCHD